MLRAVPRRFLNTYRAPEKGSSANSRLQSAASPSIPLRKSTGLQASRILSCGMSWIIEISSAQEIGADLPRGRQVKRRQGQGETRSVGPFDLEATTSQVLWRRRPR